MLNKTGSANKNFLDNTFAFTILNTKNNAANDNTEIMAINSVGIFIEF